MVEATAGDHAVESEATNGLVTVSVPLTDATVLAGAAPSSGLTLVTDLAPGERLIDAGSKYLLVVFPLPPGDDPGRLVAAYGIRGTFDVADGIATQRCPAVYGPNPERAVPESTVVAAFKSALATAGR